jgi:hypothetical protein
MRREYELPKGGAVAYGVAEAIGGLVISQICAGLLATMT